MKNCKRFQKMISDYVEGELGDNHKNNFEKHLQMCKTCHQVILRIRKLRESLGCMTLIQTSADFDTVLRTRIKIESGIGRRRLQEIIWSWPAKIPVYGMAVALIVIAMVLVFEQTKKTNQTQKPEAYVDTQWYGGNPEQNNFTPILVETENVIYVIDRMTPEKFYTGNINESYKDSITKSEVNDSLKLSKIKVQQANQMIY